MRGPLLMITGDGDEKNANDQTGPSRRVAYDHLPAGDKALLYLTVDYPQVSHGSFDLGDADEPGMEPFNDALRGTVLAWFDAHLRDDPAARAWLDSDGPTRAAAGAAEWHTK